MGCSVAIPSICASTQVIDKIFGFGLGGSADENASIGEIIGPAIPYDEVVDAIERVVETYVDFRAKNESFIDAYRRVGKQPFKENLYVTN